MKFVIFTITIIVILTFEDQTVVAKVTLKVQKFILFIWSILLLLSRIVTIT